MRIDRLTRAPLILLLLIAALGLAALTPVPSDRIALITRLGRPVQVIDQGVALHWPLIDRVVLVDRRAMTTHQDDIAVATPGGQALRIDAYATWRVVDPARFLATLGTIDQAQDTVRTALAAQVQGAAADDAPALARGAADARLRAGLVHDLDHYGLAVDQVHLARVVPADGPSLDAALSAMAVRADGDAAVIAEQGRRDAALIRAEAQARAGQIYAASFGKDPQFYDFYRAMLSYDAAFAQKGSHATMVIAPDSAYLHHFGANP
jgi:membrane protease subunit HflC